MVRQLYVSQNKLRAAVARVVFGVFRSEPLSGVRPTGPLLFLKENIRKFVLPRKACAVEPLVPYSRRNVLVASDGVYISPSISIRPV